MTAANGIGAWCLVLAAACSESASSSRGASGGSGVTSAGSANGGAAAGSPPNVSGGTTGGGSAIGGTPTASGGNAPSTGGAASGGNAAAGNPSGGSATAGAASGGVAGTPPFGTSGGSAGQSGGSTGTGGAIGNEDPLLAKFSFFVTGLESMIALSGSADGFGGDLTFGETGEGAGLRGADKLCAAIAERSLPGAGKKVWRAFLSTTTGGPDGGPVHARTRVGNGPWYDARNRLVALTLADLIAENRPRGADPAIIDDLPDEYGVPNHSASDPGCVGSECPDNHQTLTGTNCAGELYTGGGNVSGDNEGTPDCTTAEIPDGTPNPAYTCNDWTSKEPEGSPWCGHSWPRRGSGLSWMSAARDGGCAPCVDTIDDGGVDQPCVGSAGGYGAFYCFEYKP